MCAAHPPLTVAVLGLGEAGSAIARDLVAAEAQSAHAVVVRGWDPAPRGDISGIPLASSAADAVSGAQFVLSINVAAVARDVARSVADALPPHCVFADLNTSAPALKRDIAAIVEPRGALFADVALMAPVPGHGIHTPALVAGSGAEQFLAAFGPLGMPIEVVSAQPGDAATRKLLRSVFMKGWAAAIIESLEAARHLGADDWLLQEIAQEFTHADERLMRRLIEGSRQHATRRTEEMTAAVELLRELDIEPRVASAAEGWLRQLADAPARHA